MPPSRHKFPTNSLFFSISMASFFSFFFFFLFLLLSSASSRHSPKPHKSKPPFKSTAIPPEVVQACQATRFPDTCQSSFISLPHNPTPLQIIQSAIDVSSTSLKTAQSMVNSILDSSAGNANRTTAAKNCIEVLDNSHYRLSLTQNALPLGRNKDARAWMTAALLFQYDCSNALKYANDTSETNKTMSFLDSLMMLTSNALSMVMSYDLFGNTTASWTPPKTERNGFWEDSGSDDDLGFRGGFPSKLTPDVTVCKDGGNGCYKTVQEAVNAAPDNGGSRKFVIHIKEGVYNEIVRIPLQKKNVVFLGDGIGRTVITGSSTVGQIGISTYNTATLGVLGDGFMASGLTIQNTAGAPTHQAVAFRSDSDLSLVENCEFIGNQDTLYAHSLRQYYKSCRIQGNVDFIFGNSAAIFDDCEILVSPRLEKPEHGENNAVTAHGRTDPAQSTGFVFQNCLINGTEKYMELYHSNPSVHKNYLGRPWKQYSRVVFINCEFEALIAAEGWMPWSGDFALNTLYYGEFENKGPGSNLSQRVAWSSKIPKDHVHTYSVQNFIQGDEWIPTSS
ncbi:probable pectinesterase/pectinesterase inhibitor 51 isoform X2 [Euphorbia lathyris]|uniref:probable pectinesterase/pectinesterase inhibitor 51 isoform X2 n=1 Tax=Euphorbia lathyris TaxID=212925 RepID=UPI003313C641